MWGGSLREGQKCNPGRVKSKFHGPAEVKSLVGSRTVKRTMWLWGVMMEERRGRSGGGCRGTQIAKYLIDHSREFAFYFKCNENAFKAFICKVMWPGSH